MDIEKAQLRTDLDALAARVATLEQDKAKRDAIALAEAEAKAAAEAKAKAAAAAAPRKLFAPRPKTVA